MGGTVKKYFTSSPHPSLPPRRGEGVFLQRFNQKIISGIKRLSRLPRSLQPAYFKSGFDYFFPKFNLMKTLERIVPQASLNQISMVVDSTLHDQTLLDIQNLRSQANGMLSDHELNFIHALVLLSQPEVIIETGVASGGSSASLLSGLGKNHKGKLVSIDLPCVKKNGEIVCMSNAYQFQPHETSTVPNFDAVGWLVAAHCKDRWSLRLGDSLELLPQILEALGKVDLFLHDSLHTYSHMKSEFEIVWPYLSSGGLLLADDIFAFEHSAFSDFARHVDRSFFSYSGIGIIVK